MIPILVRLPIMPDIGRRPAGSTARRASASLAWPRVTMTK